MTRLPSSLLTLVILCATAVAEPRATTAPSRTGHFIAPASVDLKAVLGDPPADDSATTRQEIEELLRLQKARTPEEAARVQANEKLTVYAFTSVLGEDFTAAKLPEADKFLARVGANIMAISGSGKAVWKRPRPFKLDARLEPIVKTQSPSYPSGHTTRGYAWAAVLGELYPNKKEALLEKAREIGEDRMLGGVHYRSDIEAGKKLGLAIAAKLIEAPAFQEHLAAAKEEVKGAAKSRGQGDTR